ncbi:MAG: hypothetical protein DWQ19_12205 [Crenarchaeota archaeon]|mgnify:CR=1 FL=1|nr:MAG: hypothetical protein DWQ19_12205 [Thermoproteota archaeon]
MTNKWLKEDGLHVVEFQDGKPVNADEIFKDVSCEQHIKIWRLQHGKKSASENWTYITDVFVKKEDAVGMFDALEGELILCWGHMRLSMRVDLIDHEQKHQQFNFTRTDKTIIKKIGNPHCITKSFKCHAQQKKN